MTSSQASLRRLLLGGDQDLKDIFPTLGRVSLASPEYKSPPPPEELFCEFPASAANGRGDGMSAEDEIRLLLDRVLKHPTESAPLLVPTVSKIGQSASSIHVHVNIKNSQAWPRTVLEPSTDLAMTQQLLAVVASWIRFDGVVRTFAKPWMWRDRSLSSMFAAGPEYVWKETAWKQGTTVLDDETAADLSSYNVPAFFRHAFDTYCSRTAGGDGADSRGGSDSPKIYKEESGGSISGRDGDAHLLFDRVFDYDAVYRTLFRNNSLNMLALRKYGTVCFP